MVVDGGHNERHVDAQQPTRDSSCYAEIVWVECGGQLTPDTFLGEDDRHPKVFNEQRRCSFTPEFRREADSLVLDQGYSFVEAARSLGLVKSGLRH